MPIQPTSFENIKVGYISETDGYVHEKSVVDANNYEELYPGTQYIFINGDGKVVYLDIAGVNALTPRDLLRSDPCDTTEKPCGPPSLKFFGGHGIVGGQIPLGTGIAFGDKYFGRDEYANSVVVKSKINLAGKIFNVKATKCNYNTIFRDLLLEENEIAA